MTMGIDIVKEGEKIYKRRYKRIFEQKYKGKVVAIEIESGDAFIGENVLDAWEKAREKYKENEFFFVRVGYPAVHSIKGIVKKRQNG